MNLKDLSGIVIDSMKECVDRNVKMEEVCIYMVVDDMCVPVNFAQLRFSDLVKESGILVLDNID